MNKPEPYTRLRNEVHSADLGCRKQREPLQIDDGAESSHEERSLLANLRVHPEMGHFVYVADPNSIKSKTVSFIEHLITNSNNTIHENLGHCPKEKTLGLGLDCSIRVSSCFKLFQAVSSCFKLFQAV